MCVDCLTIKLVSFRCLRSGQRLGGNCRTILLEFNRKCFVMILPPSFLLCPSRSLVLFPCCCWDSQNWRKPRDNEGRRLRHRDPCSMMHPSRMLSLNWEIVADLFASLLVPCLSSIRNVFTNNSLVLLRTLPPFEHALSLILTFFTQKITDNISNGQYPPIPKATNLHPKRHTLIHKNAKPNRKTSDRRPPQHQRPRNEISSSFSLVFFVDFSL